MGSVKTGAVSPRFSARAALGYAWVIFRARPASFLRLAALQAVVFAATGFALFYTMGLAGLSADAASAEQTAAVLRTGALTIPIYVVMVLASIWIESLWLDLFFSRKVRLWPGWGDYGRLLLSFFIVFAVFVGGYLGVSVLGGFMIGIVAALGGAGPAIVVGLAGVISFVIFLVLVQMRFTAAPGLTFREGRISVEAAWRLTGGRQGALLRAWLVYGAAYLIIFGVVLIVFSMMPVGPVQGMQAALDQPDNPLAQYTAYSPLVTDMGVALATVPLLVATNILYVPVMALSRAIGVRLVLEDEPA